MTEQTTQLEQGLNIFVLTVGGLAVLANLALKTLCENGSKYGLNYSTVFSAINKKGYFSHSLPIKSGDITAIVDIKISKTSLT